MYVFTSGSNRSQGGGAHNTVTSCATITQWETDSALVDDRIWFAAPLFVGLGYANAVTVSLTHGRPWASKSVSAPGPPPASSKRAGAPCTTDSVR